jgi:hypothetical protein
MSNTPEVRPSTQNLFDRAVMLSLEIKKLGLRRKVASQAVEVDADKDMISVSKKLIESLEYEAIASVDSDTRAWLERRSLPSSFRAGIYLIPITLISEIDQELKSRQDMREALIEVFALSYDRLVSEARDRLRALFDADNYSDGDTVRESFSLSYQFIEFRAPGSLRKLDPELFQREKLKAEQNWANAIEEGKALLRESFAQLVSHLIDRLTPGPDGKPKKFKDSIVSNFNEFLSYFKDLNIADDTQLEALTAKAAMALHSVSPCTLRTSEALRESVVSDFTRIAEELGAQIESAPARRITRRQPTPKEQEDIPAAVLPIADNVSVSNNAQPDLFSDF